MPMKTPPDRVSRAAAPIKELLFRMRDLLAVLNEQGVETTTALRERIAASIETVEARIDPLLGPIADRADSVDQVIQENPWKAVVAGATVGVAVGCVTTAVAFSLMPETGFAAKAGRYGRGIARRYRPYVRHARRVANDYWPF
jgi:ElaB/YqjD/DUF883 family membrane-anchored ribosome-binding protein